MRLAAAALAGVTLVRAASDDETKGGRYAHFNGMFFMVVFVAAVFLRKNSQVSDSRSNR